MILTNYRESHFLKKIPLVTSIKLKLNKTAAEKNVYLLKYL